MTNNEKEDKELNDYLEGNSGISNRYRASNIAEPPAHLDEKIMSAAKEAVTDNKLKSKVRFHKAPWVRPVSLAAIITLSVSLVVTMQQETGQPLISEPGSEMDGLTIISDEVVMPRTTMVDSAIPTKNEPEVKERSDKNSYDAAPAAPGAVGGYRALNEQSKAELEAREHADKKIMLKEKARSETLEESSIAAEQFMQSAPAEAAFGAAVEMKPERQVSPQEDMLLTIKSLWEEGQPQEAKELFIQFLEDNPGYSEEAIKEVIGVNIYHALIKL